MTVKEAIRLIKLWKPTTPKGFKKAGVPLGKFVGAGVFRETVQIKDLPLVVKFPLVNDDGWCEGKIHTNDEIKKIAKLKKFPLLRPYLPKVYYHDKKTGIVVMEFYPECDRTRGFESDFQLLGNLCSKLIRKLTGITVSDIHEENVGFKRIANDDGVDDQKLVLIDLGY